MKYLLPLALLIACERAPVASSPPQDRGPAPEVQEGLDDSDSLRVVALDEGEDFVLGTQGELMWGAKMTAKGPVQVWRVQTPGTLQRATAGVLNGERAIVVAFGRGRGRLDAPLSVVKIDPETGAMRTLARWTSPRADFAHLSISDALQDGGRVLVYAAYESKYMVREWIHPAGGGERQARESIRMATSRGYSDLDGDGKAEQIIGRIYGDGQTAPGDLRIRFAADGSSVTLPVDGGVRSLHVAQRGGDTAPTLYYADGWSANYAREGRAQLRRAVATNGEWQAPIIARSADEYTFNRIQPVGLPGKQELLLYGSKRLSWLKENQLTPLKGPGENAFPLLARIGADAWLIAAGAPTRVARGPSR
ncbi:MAG: hypothetical protein AAFX94_10725 [Myxococcota bacterium]